MLTEELSRLPTFAKLLEVVGRRSCLHKMLQATLEKNVSRRSDTRSMRRPQVPDRRPQVPDRLSEAFESFLWLSSPGHSNIQFSDARKRLELGFNLGGFLSEAGQ